MKRILILLLVLVLSLTAFASCEYIPAEVMDKISPILDKVGINTGKTEEPTPDDTPATPAVDADLKAAYDYIHQMTKDVAKVTGANYTVFTSAKIGEKTYQVKWEVNVDSITITPNEDGVTATVNVPSGTNVDIPYTLKYTVTNEKGESLSRSYEHVVPKFAVNTHAEYLAAESGTNLVVEGIVVAINSKAAGNTRNHLFLADANVTGGYYIYQIDVADPVADLGIQVGMTVRVTGPASPYNGMQEIKGGVPEIIDSTIKTVAPVDITDLFASGADLGKYVGLPVTIKGVTVGGQNLGGTSDYLYFNLNGKEAYLRSYKTDFPTTLPASAKEVIEAAHAAHYNWTADVTGILILYSGNPYLIPMTEDCFNYLQAKELTDAEKVADSLDNITLPGDITADTTLELPLTGKNYSEVTFTWTVDSTDFNIGADGKMPITLGSSAVTLKLTVTAKCGETTDTKEFTVNLAASLVMNEKHAYSTYLNQVTAGKVLYLDGGVSTRYLTTTTDPSKGVAVYAEQATGGYKLYILVEGAKQYITIYNNAEGKTSVNYDAAGETVFTYNKSVNAWTTVFGGKEVYLGCYNSFETVSVSNLSYITPENTGVSQFPLEILDVAVNTPINMFVNQVKNGTVLYLDGGVSTRYLTTTTDLASAVAVYAEKVTGGYKFYILVEGEKQYITMYKNSEGKDSVNYDANGTTVYTYDPTVNAWVSELDGTAKYLGTYNTFATISVSNLSYINADNTGVSQFPLDIVAGTPAPAPSCEHTNVTTTTVDPTCVAAGSTTVTCNDCGETVSTTAIDATGVHTYVDGACSVCGLPETHVHEEVTTTVDPTCTEAGYTVLTCATCEKELGERTTIPATGHSFAEGTCSVCGAADPDHYFVMTVEEALAAAVGTKVQLTGTISGFYQTWNSQFNNVSPYLTDATGKQIIIFRTTVNVGIGDTVTVKGEIGAYNNVNQIAQGNTLTVDAKHEHSYETTVVAPTCLSAGYSEHICSVCADSYKDNEVAALGHTTDNGVCGNCGEEISGETHAPVTVSKTMAELITANGWTSTTTKQSFKLDDVVSVKINGGSNTGKAYNGDHIRVYATDTPAGTITITVPEGYELVSIKITTQTGTYAFLYVDGTTTDICNKTVSVSGNSVLLNSVKNGSDGKQVRVTGIEVTYVQQ